MSDHWAEGPCAAGDVTLSAVVICCRSAGFSACFEEGLYYCTLLYGYGYRVLLLTDFLSSVFYFDLYSIRS